MRKKNRGHGRTPRPHHQPDGAVWVFSDLAADGCSYIPRIQLGPDRIFVPKDPVAYALTVIRAVEYATFDAAVVAQMTHVAKGDQALAVAVVADLRADRPPLDDIATTPLTYTPIVSQRNGRPYVHIRIDDGEDYGQWSPPEAMDHATSVLSVAAVVDLDAAYRRHLAGQLQVDPARARAVIDDLYRFRL